jgi:uncharacterized protein
VISLPDVNVLIALLDANHVHHSTATDWLVSRPAGTVALCPLAINGVARILGRASYQDGPGTVAGATERLSLLASAVQMQFVADDISLLDSSRIRPEQILGTQQITDVYLLALAVRHDAQLVTFDRTIRPDSVIGARPRHLVIL